MGCVKVVEVKVGVKVGEVKMCSVKVGEVKVGCVKVVGVKINKD